LFFEAFLINHRQQTRGSLDRQISTPPEELLLELLRATALGDQTAFAELYRITSGKLYAIASRMLRNADAASEALQEAYVRIWSQSGQYDPEKGQPIHWVSGIVRHICIDMLRSSTSRLPAGPDLDEIEGLVPPHDIVAVDIDRCLQRLDAMQSKAILMAFYLGLSHAELAKTFAVPLGTMKSTIRRGLAKLKECLDPDDMSG
jgi:RNA polymerase sigma-70 factor, ECF subfamily